MYVTIKEKLAGSIAIGHADPAAMLVRCGIVDADHADELAREYSAKAIQEKFRRLRAGQTVAGSGASGLLAKPWRNTADDDLRERTRRVVTAARTRIADDVGLRERTRRVLRDRSPTTADDRFGGQRQRGYLDEYSTAIHEAGHAFACLYYGGVVDSVQIGAMDDEYGQTEGRVLCSNSDAESRVRVNAAGPVAQAYWQGDTWRPGTLKGDWGDLINICSGGHRSTPEELAPVIDEVAALLKRHWRTVAAIADKLLDEREISGEVVKNIMRAQGVKALACTSGGTAGL